ncbi:MAG: hypothetical protein IJK64_06920 [Clostridia bacterium]|nr:hypothetical protein [Clostridia bacterium]
MKKRLIAAVLAIAVFCTAFALPAFGATDETSPFERKLYPALDKLIYGLVDGIAAMIVTPRSWVNASDYSNDAFLPGLDAADFLDAPAENAQWSLGYANASIQTGKELTEEHYVGGSLKVSKKLVTEVRDDQKVRTVAVSDGRGISVFACVDSFGMPGTAVDEIRTRFEKIAAEKGYDITAVNVSALHQHSCVDTFGMNGDIVSALFTSSFKNLLGQPMYGGQNPDFMENLYTVAVQSMVDAVEDMQPGKLYYGAVNARDYMRDKRDPQVVDPNLNRLRFVPDDADARETWIVNAGIHCVGMGAGGTVVTGDYPYFMEEYLNDNANANLFYILGAQLAITSTSDAITETDEALAAEYDESYARLAVYGRTLARLLCSITEESEVAPILNIRFTQARVDVENSILKLAGKGGLLKNRVIRSGIGKYQVATEVGYAEFGTDLAIALMPGELAPEIAFGGADTAAESWTGTEWAYAPLAERVDGRKLLVFGLTNDQVGYLLPDNEWHSFLTENEEIVSCGKQAGATITAAFFSLLEEIN